jgi:hypothetical protein
LEPHLAKEDEFARRRRTAPLADAPVCADEFLNPARLLKRPKNWPKNSKTFVVVATVVGLSKRLCMRSHAEIVKMLIIV